MQIVSGEFPFIDIFVGKLEYPDPMLHTTAPIPLILSPRKEVIPAVPIDLIVNETAGVSLSALIGIVSPSTLDPVFNLALVAVPVAVFYQDFVATS